MTEAEKLFNQVWRRFIDRQASILSFRITSEQGMEAAKRRIWAEKVRFVNDMLDGGDYDKIFLDKEGFFKAMPPEKLIEHMTEETVRQARIAVDAASIVFAHSFLDGAAFDYCRVAAMVSPKDWEPALDKRQVSLGDVKKAGYEEVFKMKLNEFLTQLEKESLLKKVDVLFAKCQPPEKWCPMRDYSYDRDRLKRLDEYRHEIIHGDHIGPIDNADTEVDYLTQTALFLMGLLNFHYKIMLDPYYAVMGQELKIGGVEV